MKKRTILALSIILCSVCAIAQTTDYELLIRNAKKQKDTASVVNYFLEKNDKIGPDTTADGRVDGNNLICTHVLPYSRVTKSQLKGSIKYMSLFINNVPDDEMGKNVWGGFMDTYANLFYCLGKKREAITWQKRAVGLWPWNKEIAANLKRFENSAVKH